MIEAILVEGLIYGIMALGVFITFRILDFPDLSVDGTFPLGAAVMASALTAGWSPLLSLLLAFAAGAAAGMVTALIHNTLKVPGLLAGILTMTMLWSINIRVLGNRANLPLMRVETMLSRFQDGWGSVFFPTHSPAGLLFRGGSYCQVAAGFLLSYRPGTDPGSVGF
jgi:putative ABC transport system permease protein